MRLKFIVLALAGLIIGFVSVTWWFSPRLVSGTAERGKLSAADEFTLVFSQPIAEDETYEKFTISPLIPGEFLIEGEEVTFSPNTIFDYGTTYTVSVDSGVTGINGLPSLKGFQSVFEIDSPSVIFLKDVNGVVNLWNKREGQAAQQFTREPFGIWDYNVAPDGSGLIVSSIDPDGSDDLVFVDRDGERRVILQCKEARCRDGRWQPQGSLIAYERQPLSGSLNASAVWLIDIESGETWLAQDPRQLSEVGLDSPSSRFPRWSPDGRFLAYYKTDAHLIVIQDIIGSDSKLIPANVELMGDWSPLGKYLAYIEQIAPESDPEQIGDDGHEIDRDISLRNHLVLANMISGDVQDLSVDQPYDDGVPTWNPNRSALILGKNMAGSGRQIWQVDLNSGQGRQLSDNPLYHHTSLVWAPDGRQVTFVKVDASNINAQPGVWLLDPRTDESVLVEEGAFLPGWLP